MRHVTDEILQACRADPTRDAPLVHALIAATDPETGPAAISDDDISNDLLIFMLAGHDTTATALTYCAVGARTPPRHPGPRRRRGRRDRRPRADARRRAAARRTPSRCLHEALRLCPPAAGVGGWRSRDIEVDGYRVEAGSSSGGGNLCPAQGSGYLGTTRWSSTRTGSARRTPGTATAGTSSRSSAGDVRASASTSRGWRPPSRWPPSSGRCEIRSLDKDFPCDVPFTTVAKGPIRARVSLRA